MRRINTHRLRSAALVCFASLLIGACGQGESGSAAIEALSSDVATQTDSAEAAAIDRQLTPASDIQSSTDATQQPTVTTEAATTDGGAVVLPVTSSANADVASLELATESDADESEAAETTSTSTVASTETTVAQTASSTAVPQPTSTTARPRPTTTQAPTTQSPTTAAPASGGNSGLTYKGVLAAGDNSITAFDNARKQVKNLFVAGGVQPQNLIELSRTASEQQGGVRATSVGAIEKAMLDLKVGAGDACIMFITSHGSRQAWYIRGDAGLTPQKLDQILSNACGNRPTVALISACYSGIFIDPVARSNRVILTAASAINTSFGCSPEATYTYWDGCLITHFPQATTWEDLYRRVTGCIEGKEANARVTPSRPQAHFGSDVANMRVLNH